MRNVAVFGANGFIGRNTVAHLGERAGCRVFPATRAEVDLLDAEAVREFMDGNDIEVAIHCANQGGTRKDDPDDPSVVANNLRMFFHIQRCVTPGRVMVSFGSGAQYDRHRDLRKVGESAFGERVPPDAYGFSKYVMSKFIREYGGQQNGGKIYNLVVFGMYGPSEDYAYRFISNAIVRNLLRMPIAIHQNVVFDYLFIEDYLRILDLLLEKEWETRELNLTPTSSISLLEIAEIVNRVGGQRSEVTIDCPGMNYEYTGDNALLRNEIGPDFRFTPYEEGIAKLYEYYSKNLGKLDLSSFR